MHPRIFIQAPMQRIFKVLMRGPLQKDFLKEGPAAPAIQEPSTRLTQELSYKHLQDMASAISSRTDLEGLTRISTRSSRTCTGLHGIMQGPGGIQQQEPVYVRIYYESQTKRLRTARARLCASLRNRNSHGTLTRAILRGTVLHPKIGVHSM